VSGGGGILSLPVFEFPDPSSRVLSRPDVPDRGGECAKCHGPVGRSYAGQPALAEGFCQGCRHPYSFLPNLHEGDLVHGQYQVIGCFARGGLGWVYLARDTRLENLVVLKGLIDVGNAALAKAERDTLIRMDHQNIVRIFNFVEHPDVRGGPPRDYIVMEYVDGLVLSEVKEQAVLGKQPLGEPLRVEHVIACGLQVLAAFEYLHGRGQLYCDMKPENVILRPGNRGEREDNRVKIIDLGAVRKFDDRESKIIGTPGYQVDRKEIDDCGLTVQSDIYTLGKTLTRLFHATVDWAAERGVDAGTSPVAVGLNSFGRLQSRALHADPDQRFATAAEMSEQLKGVQREISALREGVERPAPSTIFAPTAVLMDAGLGVVPPLDRWTCGDRSTGTGAPLPDGLPAPPAVAVGLPTPQVDPDDDAATDVTAATGARDPHRLLDKLAMSEHDTPEVCFVRCRAQIELKDLEGASDSLGQAQGATRKHDWRVPWHNALLALARNDVVTAEAAFGTVYDMLPGEYAPKLALGFCAEQRGNRGVARRLYEAVWRRDHLQVSAAFGLARISLSQGDRAGTVAILDEVPKVSRHYDAAAVAAVLVLSGQLSSRPPSPDDLSAAAQRLPGLYLDGGDDRGDARDRLTAIIREAAFVLLDTNEGGGAMNGGTVFGDAPSLPTLRVLLEESYRSLARQARNVNDHNVLIDLTNTVRPWTFR
jgi:serine/threonine-protein kinase PknG